MAILLLCGDISQNPGPTESFSTNTSTSEANGSFSQITQIPLSHCST